MVYVWVWAGAGVRSRDRVLSRGRIELRKRVAGLRPTLHSSDEPPGKAAAANIGCPTWQQWRIRALRTAPPRSRRVKNLACNWTVRRRGTGLYNGMIGSLTRLR